MTFRRPPGGVGSNQYQSKPGPPVLAGTSALSAQDVAWVFHPDRDQWTTAGFATWAQAGPWIEAGFTATAAREWVFQDPTVTVTEAKAWMAAGFGDFTAFQWASKDFEPADAQAWLEAGFTHWVTAAHYRDQGMTVEQATIMWKAQGFNRQHRIEGSWSFPDPVEFRRWVDWVAEHYPPGSYWPRPEWHQIAKRTRAAGSGYDFEKVAAAFLPGATDG